MLILDDLQHRFARALTGTPDAQLLALIGGNGAGPAARLSIYQNNVVCRLKGALASTYPVVCKLVDPGFFDYAADAYIRTTLPTGSCLDEYGEEFPSFLETFPPAVAIPYLADVARLEWHIARWFRSARRAGAPAEVLVKALQRSMRRRTDAARIRFQFAPAVRFLSSHYAIDGIWKAHQEEGVMTAVALGNTGVNLQISGSNRLCLLNLPLPAWTFRSRLGDGATLGAAFSSAAALCADFDCASEIRALLNDGCVTEITGAARMFPL